jgi:hypothetical protein
VAPLVESKKRRTSRRRPTSPAFEEYADAGRKVLDPVTANGSALGTTRCYSRDLIHLVVEFGRMTLGEVVRTIRAMRNDRQLTEAEAIQTILYLVETHADRFLEASPEYGAVSEFDARARAFGAVDATAFNAACYDEQVELSPEIRALHQEIALAFSSAYRALTARLLRECGEDQLAEWTEADNPLLSVVQSQARASLGADPSLYYVRGMHGEGRPIGSFRDVRTEVG